MVGSDKQAGQAVMVSGGSDRQFEDCLLMGQHLKFQVPQLHICLLSQFPDSLPTYPNNTVAVRVGSREEANRAV